MDADGCALIPLRELYGKSRSFGNRVHSLLPFSLQRRAAQERWMSNASSIFTLSCLFVLIPLQPAGLHSQTAGRLVPDVVDYTVDESGNPDKCGYDPETTANLLKILGNHWGYGYDSLLVDLQRWQKSRYVTVSSIGSSVLGRGIWELTITGDSDPGKTRRTVHIHARTHPGEVQSWWVTGEIISILLAEDDFAQSVRKNCIFYIIPMYNPDGVELEYARENANGIDIESNWNKTPVQPEVAALRNRYLQLMDSAAPIEIALNMHSAYGINRYFVYHDPAGCSPAYADLERHYIEGTRYYFPEGIRPWNFYVSWTSGTSTQYPESWFWLNYHEKVMALTYEDMNDPSAGDFHRTAAAIVHGIVDHLGRAATGINTARREPDEFLLEQNYPNPFNPVTTIVYQIEHDLQVNLRLFDLQGRQIATLAEGLQTAGRHEVEWNAAGFPSGIYFYSLEAGSFKKVRRAVLSR